MREKKAFLHLSRLKVIISLRIDDPVAHQRSCGAKIILAALHEETNHVVEAHPVVVCDQLLPQVVQVCAVLDSDQLTLFLTAGDQGLSRRSMVK